MFNAVNFSDNVEMIVGAFGPRQQGKRVADRDQADAMSHHRSPREFREYKFEHGVAMLDYNGYNPSFG
jgi:hypothetical protein